MLKGSIWGTSPKQEPSRPKSYASLRAFGNGLLELAIHAVGLFAILVFIRLVERFLQFLWGTEDVIFFRVFKLKYLFQTADLVMLVGFLCVGTYKFLRAINRE